MANKTLETACPITPRLFAPLRLSLFWLIGTYSLFLVIGEIGKVPDLFKLTAYVALTIACFASGYWFRAIRYRGVPSPEPIVKTTKQIRALVVISGFYYLVYAVAYLDVFGVAGPNDLIDALLNPGEAYFSKFEIFEQQRATAKRNALVQAVTIAAALSVPLIPLTIIYFRRLTIAIRCLAVASAGMYAVVYLSIGTLVGLGTLLLYVLVGVMVANGPTSDRKRRRGAVMGLVGMTTIFAGYMSYNQSTRLDEVGISYRYEPNPIVNSLIGSEQFARGVTVTGFYPTHGYLGLAYNMESEFVWTRGRGATRALDSYLAQYRLGESVAAQTYPSRTEVATGWPAGMYWSTIYPWLASDLTFLGAAAFMFLVGWWMARWWWEATVQGRWLSLFLFSQMVVLLAYVPANHQLGLSRPNLITMVTLLGLYLTSPRGSSRSAAPLQRMRSNRAHPR